MKSLVRWLVVALTLAASAGCTANPVVAQADAPPGAGMKKAQLLWLGQACWKITTPGGHVIVIDPWLLKNPKTPDKYKDLAALGHVDLILVTHAHGDHFADAPALARMNRAPIFGPAGLQQTMLALGIVAPELAPRFNKGGGIEPWPGVKIVPVHAEHSSEFAWTNPATGKPEVHDGSEPMGYIVTLENGFRFYHMGDTGLFGDMKLYGEYYKPDLVMIPIGGNFVMDPKDAAYAIRDLIKPKYAVPMHYGTNPLMKGTPEQFILALGRTSTQVLAISPGETLEF